MVPVKSDNINSDYIMWIPLYLMLCRFKSVSIISHVSQV